MVVITRLTRQTRRKGRFCFILTRSFVIPMLIRTEECQTRRFNSNIAITSFLKATRTELQQTHNIFVQRIKNDSFPFQQSRKHLPIMIKDDSSSPWNGSYINWKDKRGKVDYAISETNILYFISYIKNSTYHSKSGNKPVNYIFSTSLSLIPNNHYRHFQVCKTLRCRKNSMESILQANTGLNKAKLKGLHSIKLKDNKVEYQA